jgi:restriction system protein
MFDTKTFVSSIFGPLLVLLLKYWYWAVLAFVGWFVLEFWPDIVQIIKHRRAFRRNTQFRNDQDELQWLRGMNPTQFEQFIAELFRKLGYSAEAVGRSHDQGIDVVIKKDGLTHYVQCKKYTSSVPVGAVRDFYGAIVNKGVEAKGFFVTTGIFTLEAEQFAQDKPLELIGSTELMRLIHSVRK